MPKTKNVAILMNLNRIYDRQVIRGITQYVQSAGYWHLYVEEDPADKIPSFADWSSDGMIVDTDDRQISAAIGQLACPLVAIGTLAPDVLRRLPVSTVRSDNETIARWAAGHLLEKGIRSFGYYGMRTRGLDRWAGIRRDTFRQQLAKHGFPCAVFTGRLYAPRHWGLLQTELQQWLEGLPKPVGIMACNDWRGRHLLEACRQLGLRVPDDAAVIGVDNDELVCESAIPPLTSVAQDAEAVGYQAAGLLDQLMRDRRCRPTHLVIPPACLVERESTDMVATDDPVVSGALHFIRGHASRGINVADVVHHLDVSRSTIEKKLKHRLGRTVHDEIQRVRLEAARRLIATTDLPLHEVADRAGFSTVQYMSAVFQRELGHPPGQLRRQQVGS